MNAVLPRGPPSPRWLVLAAALLLVPGLWMRVTRLEWMEFSGDELMTMVEPYRAAHGPLALHGILTSMAVSPPNFLLYVLALPVSLTREPTTLVWFVVLWNLAGLACVLRLLWRALGASAALAGTALLASAPGPVLLSRKIWNPDFIPASVALLLLLLALQAERPRRWALVGAFAVGTILCGFHISAFAVLPCVLAWTWLVRVRIERRALLLAILASLLLLAPYLWFLVSSGFDDVREALAVHAHAAPASESWSAALARHARAALECWTGGGILESGASGARAVGVRVLSGFFAAWTAASVFLVWLRAPGIVRRCRSGEDVPVFEKLLVLGALLEVGLLLFLAQSRLPSVPHYYAVLLPFPLLSAAWLGLRAGGRLGALPLVCASALVVAGNTLGFDDFLGRVQRGAPGTAGRFAAPFAPRAEHWRAEIARAFGEIDTGHAERRAEQQRLRELFAASTEVLGAYDPRRDDPPALVQGRLALQPTPGGLEVEGSTALDMLRLPPFELGGRGRALLRLSIRAPKDVIGCVFYADGATGEYRPGRAIKLELEAGENEVFVLFPEADAGGRPMLRLFAARYLLRAAELRRVPG